MESTLVSFEITTTFFKTSENIAEIFYWRLPILKCDIKMYEGYDKKYKPSKFSFSAGRDTEQIIIKIYLVSVALVA